MADPAYDTGSGNPLYNADGHPMEGCCCDPATYRQWRLCADGELVEMWSLDTGAYPQYRKETTGSLRCLYRVGDEPTSGTPAGTLLGETVAIDDCGDCDCAAECPSWPGTCGDGCVPAQLSITFSSLVAVDTVCDDPCGSTGWESSGTLTGTHCLDQNPSFDDRGIGLGNCVWGAIADPVSITVYDDAECTIPSTHQPDRTHITVSQTSVEAVCVKINATTGSALTAVYHAFMGFITGNCPIGTWDNKLSTRCAADDPFSSTIADRVCYDGTVTITAGGC
jgi:hypothetical protein